MLASVLKKGTTKHSLLNTDLENMHVP